MWPQRSDPVINKISKDLHEAEWMKMHFRDHYELNEKFSLT